jgi:hypothetical protein
MMNVKRFGWILLLFGGRVHRKCMQIVPAESEARGAGEPN